MQGIITRDGLKFKRKGVIIGNFCLFLFYDRDFFHDE